MKFHIISDLFLIIIEFYQCIFSDKNRKDNLEKIVKKMLKDDKYKSRPIQTVPFEELFADSFKMVARDHIERIERTARENPSSGNRGSDNQANGSRHTNK